MKNLSLLVLFLLFQTSAWAQHLPSTVNPTPVVATETLPILKFSTTQKNELLARLQIALGAGTQFSKLNHPQYKTCETCLIVNVDQLSLVDALVKSSFSYKIIGQQVVQSTSSSRSGGSRDASFESSSFNNLVPTDTILDFSSQESGAWFPFPSYTTLDAFITGFWYQVGFFHTRGSDLYIDLNYNLSGPNLSPLVSTGIRSYEINSADDISSLSAPAYRVFENTTNAFDGLHPNAYYFVRAFDQVSGFYGFLDFVKFEVFWAEAPDLSVYTGVNAHNDFTYTNNRYLAVYSSIENLGDTDATSAFSATWYLTPTTNGCSSFSNFDEYSSFVVGSADNSVSPLLSSGAFVNFDITSPVDLDTLLNSFGQHIYEFAPSDYCLWVKADSQNEIFEHYENNNVYAIPTSIYFVPPSWTSIEAQSTIKLSLYPNPATNLVNIQLPKFMVGKALVLDNNGRIVRQIKVDAVKFSIDVESLAAGSYTVVIQASSGTKFESETIKFIKN